MDRTFWEQRWAAGRTAFHRPDPHPLLRRHLDRLGPPGRVYVPLCGKSVDMLLLRQHGHEVVGTEFVVEAVHQFFRELGAEPERREAPPFESFAAPGITILRGDAMAITRDHLGGAIDAVYDRGSLVAVDPARRTELADSLRRVSRRQGRILLVTLSYDQSKADGPPWSVDEATVRRLFARHASIEILDEQPDPGSPSLRDAGVSEFLERAYLIELT
ncbi:MAG: thiopurine S-methyltransferase [Planctomycetota bacterium]